MDTRIRKPRSRTCELCGRQEVWSDEKGTWTIVTEDDERQVGDPHCLHEWDITGAFTPIETTDA
ncbi:HEWD family protein [Natranaeroarchaeum sulfidigenes]|uniref:Zn finger domain containing protein n=1 Tax=Natranaeroarchaeum sulfidigenes TaxID=2784880 RepID=A0A897MNL4_9EURY|nr:HEWD family protein [Natranaeroarchaeum sulfidigenes]QSG02174.1 Zn finger domain containing protein [Natranaeroarchaeum sulfidigenes]